MRYQTGTPEWGDARRRGRRARARLCAAVTTTLVVAAVFPTVATAALWLVFDRESGRVGTVVHVKTLGQGALRPGVEPLSVFLAPASVADEIRTVRDPRLTPIGELVVDGKGNGTLTFEVPEISGGLYTSFIHCEPCAPFSAGRTFLPTGPSEPFRVVAPPSSSAPEPTPTVLDQPAPRSDSGTPWTVIILGSLAGLLIAAATAIGVRLRRSRQTGTPS